MYILDLATNKIHKYGTHKHDSLIKSPDGRYLEYYNLKNGDGSGNGDYRFVEKYDEEFLVPADLAAETEVFEYMHSCYFNIGGFHISDITIKEKFKKEQFDEKQAKLYLAHKITKLLIENGLIDFDLEELDNNNFVFKATLNKEG